MRIISQDRATNVPYENNILCIISDDEKNEHYIAVRNASLTGFMPLATYDNKEAAQRSFNALIESSDNVYYLN